jgi:hypothetical protein
LARKSFSNRGLVGDLEPKTMSAWVSGLCKHSPIEAFAKASMTLSP